MPSAKSVAKRENCIQSSVYDSEKVSVEDLSYLTGQPAEYSLVSPSFPQWPLKHEKHMSPSLKSVFGLTIVGYCRNMVM